MKRIVLASGGLDSSTLLATYAQEDLCALFFNYGQKSYEHEKEAVTKLTQKLNIRLIEKNIIDLFSSSKSDLLAQNNNEVPNFELVCRNYIFISAATALAMQLFPNEEVEILIGLIKVWVSYAGCTKEFIDKCNEASSVCSYGKVKVVAPFIDLGKDEVLALLKTTEITAGETWSCYFGGELPCRSCPACIDRMVLGE